MRLHPVAEGKRANGAEWAEFCAVYGLPGPLSYDDYVTLTICLPRAIARLASVGVLASGIASRRIIDREYCALDTVDEQQAQVVFESQLLQRAVIR